MTIVMKDLNVPHRYLLGPGPSDVHPRVLRAMCTEVIGYLDPEWNALMDEEQALLREVFQTRNQMTFPMSGTGSAGMETAFCNFVEPGDKVVIACNGYFSERMCEMAKIYGAKVIRLEKPWGGIFTPSEIEDVLIKNKPVKIMALVHAETSTGALQPLEKIDEIVHRHGALFLIDCVTSLGGIPLKIDDWGVDIAYSASQKCLGCPPGLSPVTVNDRAREILYRRKKRVSNWYLDLTMVEKYWNQDRIYHHTPSTTLHYGFREGLRLILEEGLEARWIRHQKNAEYLWDKLEALGLKLFVPAEYRLPSLSTVCIPDGVEDATVRTQLRETYGIDIAGGFGPLKGKIWRIGLMGYSSRHENITLLAEALREIFRQMRMKA